MSLKLSPGGGIVVRIKIIKGFTLIELMVVVVIVGILVVVAVPVYSGMVEKSKVGAAIADIAKIGQKAVSFKLNNNRFPDSLAELSGIPLVDPWENNYRYLNLANIKGKGAARKNRNLVPINTEFDIYSVGKDGASVSPLTAKPSRDDVVWANDGQYIGLAENY